MIELTKTIIPQPLGKRQISKYLANAGTLSDVAATLYPQLPNKIYSYLPQDFSLKEDAFNFSIATSNLRNSKTANQLLRQEITERLRKLPTSIILVENPLAKPTDTWLKNRQCPILIYDDTIIHYLKASALDLIDAFISESASSTTVNIFIVSEVTIPNDGEKITNVTAKTLITNLHTIIIRGVFDGESLLIDELAG